MYLTIVKLILGPFKNWQGFVGLILITFILTSAQTFLFVNHTFQNVYFHELKGIYPGVFWKGNTESVLDKVEALGYSKDILKREKFAKNTSVDIKMLGTDGSTRVYIGLRIAEYSQERDNKNHQSIPYHKIQKQKVIMSDFLYEELFQGKEFDSEKLDSIWLKVKSGEYKEFIINDVFSLFNDEKWLLLHGSSINEIDAKSIHRFDIEFTKIDDFLKKLEPQLSNLEKSINFYTWQDIIPVNSRIFWELIKLNAFVLVLAIGVLITVFMSNYLKSISYDLKLAMFLYKFFGISRMKVIFVSNSLLVITFTVLIVLGILLNYYCLSYINSDTFPVSQEMYLKYVTETVIANNSYILMSLYGLLCIPMTLFVILTYRKDGEQMVKN